jgi:hypothetical protein
MNTKPHARSYIVTLMTVLALTACGKSMHVAVNGMNGNPAGSAGSSDQSTDTQIGDHIDATKSAKVLNTASPAEATAKKSAEQKIYDGQLQPYSEFDLSELANLRPFLNSSDRNNSIREIGEASYLDKQIHLGFTQGSNVVFRAVKQMPSKDVIAEIGEFSLEFRGIRVFVPSAQTLAKADLTGQILCIVDGKQQCSGEIANDDEGRKNRNDLFWKDADLVNAEFSRLEMGTQVLNYADKGSVFEPSQQPIKIDLKKAFGLEKLSQLEMIDWLYAHSTEYAENGYRKFRFVIGNNVFLQEGTLNLEIINKPSVLPDQQAAGAVKNGETDKTFPKAIDASVVLSN